MDFVRDRYYRLTVRREGEDLVQYLRLRFDNESSEVVMNGAGQAEGDPEAGSDEGSSPMFPQSLVFIDPTGQVQRFYEHEIREWELLPD